MKLFDSLPSSRDSGVALSAMPRGRCASARAGGFTLVEALVVVTIIGILGAFAVPAFQEMIRRGQLTATTQNLLADLRFARNEAIRQGTSASLVENGGAWQVLVGGQVLQQRQASSSITLTLNPAGNIINFQPRGSVTVAVDISLSHNDAHNDAKVKHRACVRVSRAGNATVSPSDRIEVDCTVWP